MGNQEKSKNSRAWILSSFTHLMEGRERGCSGGLLTFTVLLF